MYQVIANITSKLQVYTNFTISRLIIGRETLCGTFLARIVGGRDVG